MSVNGNLDALNFLLKAPSKSLVLQLIKLCFSSRNDSCQPTIYAIKTLLDITCDEATELCASLSECIGICLTEGSGEALTKLLEDSRGGNVDPRLKSLLATIISGELAGWLEPLIEHSVSFTKCTDLIWAIQTQDHLSSNGSDFPMPVVIINLKLEEEKRRAEKVFAKNLDLIFETDSTSLDILLEKFRNIKKQISLLDK